jgi:hypothetical protein
MHDVLRSSSDVVEVVGGDCWGGSSSLDAKPGAVVLHDRLMTDAALGAVPIKTEHSYSLASDGDSMPESPISLETMDDGKLISNFINVMKKKNVISHTFVCIHK